MRDIEKYTADYSASDFEQKYQARYRREKIIELLNKYPHGHILDVGCGVDPLARYCAPDSEWTIVEPSHEFIENAKSVLSGGARVHYIEGLLEDVAPSLERGRFDYIVVSSLLHELESPATLLRSIYELADEQTTIYINVPNAHSLHRLLAVEAGLIPAAETLTERNALLQQHAVYDLASLTRALELVATDCGRRLDILDSGSFFVKPFTHRQMEQCLVAGILTDDIIDGFSRMTRYMPELGSEIFVNFRLARGY